jgi:aryl sulfotransferase
MLHFSNLKRDMPSEIRKIANFLEIVIDQDKWDNILEHCSFEYMKEHASTSVPLGGAFWDGGSKTFINKGTNGRWKDVLSQEDSSKYEEMAVEKFGEDCARWINTGELSNS